MRRVALASLAVFSLGAVFWGASFLLGVVAGGGIAMAGFAALVGIVERLTDERPGGLAWLSVAGLVLRYILLSLVLFVIIGVWRANVVAVALGFSAPVAAVFAEAGLHLYRELRSRT